MLILAAILAFLIGLAHSVLGERYILMRLFRQPLPELFGSDAFTRKTLRFAWHITTVAWCGFGVLLIALHRGQASPDNILYIVGTTFGVTAAIALTASGGRHLSWLVFGAISAICLLAASGS